LGGLNEGILLEIVGSIYDCVIEPSGWQPAVSRIQRTFRWHNAILAANSLIGEGAEIQVILDVPEPYMSMTRDPVYSQPILELWGGMAKVIEAPLEEPLVQSAMGNPENWPDNKYFADFVAPQGIVDAVTIGLARDGTMIANIAGGRHRSEGPFDDVELAGLRVLAPHLRRAVTIANLFDGMRADSGMFAAALETSRAGIVLVDETMAIVHANSNAHEMLSTGDPIQETSGRLTLREELSHNALSAAVTSGTYSKLGRRGAGIPTRRRDGSPLLVHVLPLTGGRIRPGVASRACAAVLVALAPEPIRLSSEALGLLLDLTPAEVRVMELACDGFSIADIALRLGIAPSTAKTHLQRVYEKTGTHRQGELVKLARQFTPV
jgi:DNA-binding CsgD family transcriptional regulator